MTNSNKTPTEELLSEALCELLFKKIPPRISTPHLKDLVKLLIYELSKGEVFLKMGNITPSIKLQGDGWPHKHIDVLLDSGWLDGDDSPMVLEDNSLCWRRWHNEMQSVLIKLNEKSLLKPYLSKKKISNDLSNNSQRLNKQQLIAIKAITQQNLILLTGGPGTGKTNTIVEMLIKALSIESDLNIGLAAPTGKAARRLKEAIKNVAIQFDLDLKKKITKVPCLTIHRWLQAVDGRFKKCKTNPLQLDLLVIDEMSMVDLLLMQGLLDALPASSQLILVGDSYQLPPVSNGAIWHTLQSKNTIMDFSHCSVHLTKCYRNRGDIANLARTIKENDLNVFFRNLTKLPSSSNVKRISSHRQEIPNQIINTIKVHQKQLKTLTTQLGDESYSPILANKILDHLEELMILCPKKYGFWSVDHIHRTLLGELLHRAPLEWPEGTPVLCGQNQPELGLSNGDIGIIIGNNPSKKLLFRVHSVENQLTSQAINPTRIKKLEPAFALTIHKAQGSESTHVICLWPEAINDEFELNNKNNENEDYNKKLIYTAITRAKTKLDFAIPIYQKQIENFPITKTTRTMID